METRHSIIPAAYLILEKEDNVLLLKRKNTGYEDGNYSLIAGHVEEGETFTETMLREVTEEAGVTVKKEDLKPFYIAQRKSTDKSERIDVFFTCSHWEGEIKNMEPEKCSELKWFPKHELPNNIIEFIKEVLSTDETQFFGEHNWA